MAFKITPKKLGGAIGAVDGLEYMSSPNVVFVCKAGRMFYTVNKPLVPEWPCIIEVSYIYPPTNLCIARNARVDSIHIINLFNQGD